MIKCLLLLTAWQICMGKKTLSKKKKLPLRSVWLLPLLFRYLEIGQLRHIFSEYQRYLLGNWADFYGKANQQLLSPTWVSKGLVCRKRVSCIVDSRSDWFIILAYVSDKTNMGSPHIHLTVFYNNLLSG